MTLYRMIFLTALFSAMVYPHTHPEVLRIVLNDPLHLNKLIYIVGFTFIFKYLKNPENLKFYDAVLGRLGLLGTLLGFMYSLASIEPNSLSDFESQTRTLVKFLSGMGFALTTTALSVIFYFCLELIRIFYHRREN